VLGAVVFCLGAMRTGVRCPGVTLGAYFNLNGSDLLYTPALGSNPVESQRMCPQRMRLQFDAVAAAATPRDTRCLLRAPARPLCQAP
jgi:hypothetical protein